MTYEYLECSDCQTANLADSEYCWYCGSESLKPKTAEWREPEPSN